MIRRPVGALTRGTTNPNRLRRVDNFLAYALGAVLRSAADPLVVDLGYGASPVTTVELLGRLTRIRPDVRVVGIEIDPARVAAAASTADPPRLEFRRGGFELAGLRPVIVRALNVLRQYDEAAVAPAWATMRASLAPGGVIIEGTCDELGRLGAWLTLTRGAAENTGAAGPANREAGEATGAAGPATLTLAANLALMERPAVFAERLPKALIHRNVPGEGVYEFLRTLDQAWDAAAGYAPYGPTQRFVRAVAATRAAGWPIRGEPRRWRHGELTIGWDAVNRRSGDCVG